ncbi:hypothetical protein EYF80_019830 [Liparis tanakae]|uniref:Uncharacterized protein n=1 Tax=Liparis tanakae TaxID=230148 RepID=A0A4Z2HW87_9TELE|nr:hypothetical protein EYF80_019830 [Liparis tanakae]
MHTNSVLKLAACSSASNDIAWRRKITRYELQIYGCISGSSSLRRCLPDPSDIRSSRTTEIPSGVDSLLPNIWLLVLGTWSEKSDTYRNNIIEIETQDGSYHLIIVLEKVPVLLPAGQQHTRSCFTGSLRSGSAPSPPPLARIVRSAGGRLGIGATPQARSGSR